jgi:hypothetical protein
MSLLQTADDVAEYFVTHIQALTLTKNKNISYQGGRYYYKPNPSHFKRFFELLKPEQQTEIVKKHADRYLEFSSTEFLNAVEDGMVKRMRGTPKDLSLEASRKYINPNDVYFTDSITTPLAKLRLIFNVKDIKRNFIYDPVQDRHYNYSGDFINQRLRGLLGDGTEDWKASNSEDCYIAYSPNRERIYRDEAGHKVFNTWIEAGWREGWEPDTTARCPVEIDEYLSHFLVDDESRTYCKAWLRDATFERAEPILVLCGMPGSGKNIFIEHLAAALVGRHNYRSASRGFNKSYFHNNISSCRLFFQDEMALTHDSRETLKAYHNGVAAIERKGKDVEDPEKIYASFALANNLPRNIKLEYTDRKFYVPLVSDKPLMDSWGQDNINKFLNLLKDDNYVRQFASYLFANFKSQMVTKFPRNHFFKELCINSYPQSFRRFIKACQDEHEISSVSFNRGSRYAFDPYDLKDHLQHYRANFKEDLADLTIHSNGRWEALSKICKVEMNGAVHHGANGLDQGITVKKEIEPPVGVVTDKGMLL